MDIEYQDLSVQFQTVQKNQVQKPPCVRINKVSSKFFTLVMVNLDTKYIHWWVYNIKYKNGNCVCASELMPYIGPEKAEQKQRYAFLLYEHEKPIIPLITSRKNFTNYYVKNLRFIEKKGFFL